MDALVQLHHLYTSWEQQEGNRLAHITFYADQSGRLAWGSEKVVAWDNFADGVALLRPLATLSRDETRNFLMTHLYCRVCGWFEADAATEEYIPCPTCGITPTLSFFPDPPQTLGEYQSDFRPICEKMQKDGVEITPDTLCTYIRDFYSTLWEQLGDYPFGIVAAWLDKQKDHRPLHLVVL